MKIIIVAISFLLITLQCASAARILAFMPMPWRSHQFIFRPLIRELAKKGHQVDFYTPLPMKDPPSSLRQFVVKDWQHEAMESMDESEMLDASPFRAQTILSDLCLFVLEKTFTNDQVVIDLLQSKEKYDAVISEYPLGIDSSAYLLHKFKGALNIVILGFPDYPWLNEIAGLPDNPSYMVSYVNYSPPNNMTFWQRLSNFYMTASTLLAAYLDLVRKQQPAADRFIRYEGWETRPKLTELVYDVDLILTNSHVSTAYPYPRAPHVKEISGMHIDPWPLPKDLQSFMDDAPHGVIFFSLGSVVDPKTMLANGKFEIFLNVFRRLKQKVMWKVADGMPEVKDPKMKLLTWFPQQDILNHNSTVLFITHGGLQSTVEAIANGVPCLGIPFIFDQKKDVALLVNIGMGRLLDFNNLTETSLEWSINEMLNNPSYRQRAAKQKALFHDRPRKPVDEAVYWIEYVLRHGKILQPASARMPFYQLYLLDVIGFILLSSLLFVYMVKKIIAAIWSIFSSPSKGCPIKKKAE